MFQYNQGLRIAETPKLRIGLVIVIVSRTEMSYGREVCGLGARIARNNRSERQHKRPIQSLIGIKYAVVMKGGRTRLFYIFLVAHRKASGKA